MYNLNQQDKKLLFCSFRILEKEVQYYFRHLSLKCITFLRVFEIVIHFSLQHFDGYGRWYRVILEVTSSKLLLL